MVIASAKTKAIIIGVIAVLVKSNSKEAVTININQKTYCKRS